MKMTDRAAEPDGRPLGRCCRGWRAKGKPGRCGVLTRSRILDPDGGFEGACCCDNGLKSAIPGYGLSRDRVRAVAVPNKPYRGSWVWSLVRRRGGGFKD